MTHPFRLFWLAFVRILIVLLLAGVGLGVYLFLNPGVLEDWVVALPLPGVVRIPSPGPTPPAPVIAAPAGPIPAGPLAFQGVYSSGQISCGFIMASVDGRLVGLTAAHATADLPPGTSMSFQSAAGEVAARLSGPIRRGSPFVGEQFSTDYVLWTVTELVRPGLVLQPDERGRAQPGEAVWVYGPGVDAAGNPQRWGGVVIRSGPTATWVQFAESFDPHGLSGCPLVSAATGRLVGMAVAAKDQPPVVMGVNPVGVLLQEHRNK